MIYVDKLCKYFGPVMAVDRITFQVDKGEIVGFLGPNGAGKTTTMRILTSYLPATSGIAKVAGYDVMTESMEVRRNIGYLPESVQIGRRQTPHHAHPHQLPAGAQRHRQGGRLRCHDRIHGGAPQHRLPARKRPDRTPANPPPCASSPATCRRPAASPRWPATMS